MKPHLALKNAILFPFQTIFFQDNEFMSDKIHMNKNGIIQPSHPRNAQYSPSMKSHPSIHPFLGHANISSCD